MAKRAIPAFGNWCSRAPTAQVVSRPDSTARYIQRPCPPLLHIGRYGSRQWLAAEDDGLYGRF